MAVPNAMFCMPLKMGSLVTISLSWKMRWLCAYTAHVGAGVGEARRTEIKHFNRILFFLFRITEVGTLEARAVEGWLGRIDETTTGGIVHGRVGTANKQLCQRVTQGDTETSDY